MNASRVRIAALATGDVAVLVVVHPDWRAVLSGLAAPRAWLAAGPDAAVAQACGSLLWLAAAWIGIGLFAGVGARIPGAAGRHCARCARVVVPRVLVRVVLGSTGLGLLAAPAAQAVTTANTTASGAGSQVAATSTWVHPIAASTWIGAGVPSPGWPVGPGSSTGTLPAPTPPTTNTPTSAPTPPTTTPSAPIPPTTGRTEPPTPSRPASRAADLTTVRVHPGDSLWLLAGRRLGAHAAADDIAHYWPQVYAANRSVLGDDPSDIRPGQVLDLPAPTTQESS